jgi:plasmid stabilization system protein ParE
LIERIESLKFSAMMHAVTKYQMSSIYGIDIRRINYKNWAIFYTINGNTVRIERIIHGSLIKKTTE